MVISDDPMVPSQENDIKAFAMSEDTLLELDEIKTYFVKFYDGHIPEFFANARGNAYCSYVVRREYSENLYEINFQNSVGMTRIGPLKVRVKSLKIPEDLYHTMLDYITGKYANLVFSFGSYLGQSYRKKEPGFDIAYVEYLFLKKYLIDGSPDLDGIAALIFANPHMKLHSEYNISPIEKVSSFQPDVLFKTLMRSETFFLLPEGHPLSATSLGKTLRKRTAKNLYPSEAFDECRYHTVDTNENRFVKYFLKQMQRRMEGLYASLVGTSGSYLNPDIDTNLQKVSHKIDLFLNDPMWQNVGTMSFIPAYSQILQRRDGYRQLFRLYSLLQLSTRCDFDIEDFRSLLETKDTPTLFEYWSFFLIKEILDQMRNIVSCRNIVSEDPKKQEIYKGICIQYEYGVNLWFNKYCTGSPGYLPGDSSLPSEIINESYSHSLIPDIVVSKGDKLLVFDAKYKGKRGGFYGEDESGVISSWNEGDIDKMHTYREAIRNVIGAFILYPGEKSEIYPSHDAVKLYEGVGAFPLRPKVGAIPVPKHLDNVKKVISDFIAES